MDSNFPRSLKHTLQYEGGWSDHPKDPGGATMKGVTIATYRRYINKNGTKADLRGITDEQLRTVYKRQYWDVAGCGALSAGLDFAVFDFAVNSGPGRAKKYLAKVKGKANAIDALCDARLAFMRGLGTWSTFGKGWSRRVGEVRVEARAMANSQPAAMVTITTIEPKPAPAPAPATDKAVIEAVQQRLLDLGYPPGGVDGKLGKLTASAIRDFRSENDLPVTDTIDDDLQIALGKAKPRVLARANATSAEVATKVPETNRHWWNKYVAIAVGAPTAIGGAVEQLAPATGYLQPVKDFLGDIPTSVWVIAIVLVAGVVWWNARQGQIAGDDAFRTGERL